MSNTWKWVIGIAVVIAVLFILPGLWWLFMPYGGYGRMGYGGTPMMGGWHMPMMYGGYGGFGLGMIFAWLIPLGLLVLIGLAIAALVKYLKAPGKN